jgi:hypothetical protein
MADCSGGESRESSGQQSGELVLKQLGLGQASQQQQQTNAKQIEDRPAEQGAGRLHLLRIAT